MPIYEYNDGLARVFPTTGAIKIVDNDDLTPSYSSLKHDIEVPYEPLYHSHDATVSTSVDHIPFREVQIKEFDINIVGKKPVDTFLYVEPFKAEATVIDQCFSLLEAACAKTIYVPGSAMDNSKFTKYLRITYNLKKNNPTTSMRFYRGVKMSLEDSSLSYSKIKNNVIEKMNFYDTTIAYTDEPKYIFKEEFSMVDSSSPVPMGAGTNILEPITISVEDYKPPAWGNTGSGSGVQSVRYVVQKMSFAEINMVFDDCKVTEVLGLPQGMFLDKTVIKGVPMTSGAYPIRMKLDNNRTLEGLLIVPELPRQL